MSKPLSKMIKFISHLFQYIINIINVISFDDNFISGSILHTGSIIDTQGAAIHYLLGRHKTNRNTCDE